MTFSKVLPLAVLLLNTSGAMWSQTEAPLQPEAEAARAPSSAERASDLVPAEDSRDPVLYAEETERIKPLTVKLIRNILLDQKDIWTSPFHIKKQDAVPLMVLGAGVGVLLARDRWMATQLPNTVDQVTISKDISNVGAVYTVLPVTAGLYIAGAIFHNPKARETGILSVEAVLDSLIVVEVLKVTLGRSRPLEHNGDGGFFTGGDSFPSGHSAEAWALASVVAHEYNKNIVYPIAAYSLASLVSFSRLSGQQHFGSDILVGSAIGWYVGRYVVKTHLDHSIHQRSWTQAGWLHPQVMPQFDPETRTRGVVLTWALTR